MRLILIIYIATITLCARAQQSDALMQLPPQERAFLLVRHFEGWHNSNGHVGWGHKVQPGEHFPKNMTSEQGDSLLRADLSRLVNHFRKYGDRYALPLAMIGYNCGIGAVEGSRTRPPSRLIQLVKQGRTDIEREYLDFCRWHGKIIPSIRLRRWAELRYLYNVTPK